MDVVDLSAWQDNVDWDALVDAGIGGVILKLGERSRLDNMFIEHVNNTVEHDLPYGVYYYAHADDEDGAMIEAAQVDAWLKEYMRSETPPLGIWYDAEDSSMLGGDVTATCATFLNRMTEFGYTYIGVYASWNWLSAEGAHHIEIERLPDYVPYWVAQYNRHNDLKDEYPDADIKVWQYTDHYSDELPYDGNVYYK